MIESASRTKTSFTRERLNNIVFISRPISVVKVIILLARLAVKGEERTLLHPTPIITVLRRRVLARFFTVDFDRGIPSSRIDFHITLRIACSIGSLCVENRLNRKRSFKLLNLLSPRVLHVKIVSKSMLSFENKQKSSLNEIFIYVKSHIH